ncbi:MAG: APC family permease [Anaerolineales bacterium]
MLIGSPLPTQELANKRLNKIRGLAVFSPDALSSIAYANQEIFLALVVAGSAGLVYSFPIGLGIILVLVMVTFSYFQTIHAYPTGGGSYIVASENLGSMPGLVAAAALMIDYVLVAAVSLTAGVEAIASAFPALWPYKITITLILLTIITLLNLRGIQESGTAMAVPVYLFLVTYMGMLGYGVLQAIRGGPSSYHSTALPGFEPVTIFLLLRAFAIGSTGLTGIEAISNGVPAFKQPEAKNAGRTLITMAGFMGILFVGSLGLTQYFAVIPGSRETILSALARQVVGSGIFYYLVQFSTLLILAVAANTSFASFPRLASILSEHKYLPNQLRNLGDRLVYANGMILLALVTAVLVIIFGGDTHALIPFFAVGAFLAFTLSQAGMVVHWIKLRGLHWQVKSMVNGIGALVTCILLLIIYVSKFSHGIWITLLMIPFLVWVFQRIHLHYEKVADQLSLRGLPPSLKAVQTLRLVVPISSVNRASIEAINHARSISERITALYIEIEPDSGQKVRAKWGEWFPDIPLVIEPSPYRSIIRPLLDYLDRTDAEHHDGQLAVVVLPEIIPAYSWQAILHNQNSWLIKFVLLHRRREFGYQRLIIDVPYHIKEKPVKLH